MVTNYQVDIKWMSPTMIHLAVNDELMWISRHQAGVLFLFTIMPELTRKQIYEYLAGIWLGGEPLPKPIPKTYRVSMARLLDRLKGHGLVIEHEKLLYQTMKGRTVWMSIESARKQALETLADVYAPDETKKPA